MSLGVVVKGPEGVVLAVDSRVTLSAQGEGAPPIQVHFDNATKLLTFSQLPHTSVAAVTYGAAVIGLRTPHSYLPEFEPELGDARLTVLDYARKMSAFFLKHWQDVMPPDYSGQPMTFVVGGYDPGSPYGTVYLFDVPYHPDPMPRNEGTDFGIVWGGQLQVASRLIHGYDPLVPEFLRERFNLSAEDAEATVTALRQRIQFRVPYAVLPLQDCVDLAIFLIRTTMSAQGLAVGVRGVGGPIDVVYITRTHGLTVVQRKDIRGEAER